MTFRTLPELYIGEREKKRKPVPEERTGIMNDKNTADVNYSEGSLPERYDSWIKKTLKNLIMNEVRSFKRWKARHKEILVDNIDFLDYIESYDPFEEDEAAEIPLGDTPVIIEDERLARILSGMTQKKQRVIEGTIILGIPVRIVAKKLGLDEHTVRNYKCLTLNELRTLMEGEEYE